MSTHNHVWGSKIGQPLLIPHFLYKMGFKGVFNICSCMRDVSLYFYDSTIFYFYKFLKILGGYIQSFKRKQIVLAHAKKMSLFMTKPKIWVSADQVRHKPVRVA